MFGGFWWHFFFPGWSMVFLAPRQEIHLTPAARPVVAERVWELGGMDLGLKHEHGNSGWYLMVLHGKIITFSYFFHDFWQLKHHFPAVFSRWPCCKPGSHLAYGRHPPDRFLAERPKLGNFYGDLRCRNGDFGDLWTLKHRLKRRNYKKWTISQQNLGVYGCVFLDKTSGDVGILTSETTSIFGLRFSKYKKWHRFWPAEKIKKDECCRMATCVHMFLWEKNGRHNHLQYQTWHQLYQPSNMEMKTYNNLGQGSIFMMRISHR